VGVVGVVVAAVVVVYIYPLFSGPAAPYLLNTDSGKFLPPIPYSYGPYY
jgi:hypothetical protein